MNKSVKGLKGLPNIKQNRDATLAKTTGVNEDCSLFSYTEYFSFKKGVNNNPGDLGSTG